MDATATIDYEKGLVLLSNFVEHRDRNVMCIHQLKLPSMPLTNKTSWFQKDSGWYLPAIHHLSSTADSVKIKVEQAELAVLLTTE